MTELEIDQLVSEDVGGYEIPAPRAGRSYSIFMDEVFEHRHGCLDAPVGGSMAE